MTTGRLQVFRAKGHDRFIIRQSRKNVPIVICRWLHPAIPLRVGDIILAVDGDPVRATAPGDEQVFSAVLRQYAPGRNLPLTVYRDGATVPVTVTVQLAPRSPGEMARYDDAEFAFRARDLAAADLEEPRLKGVTQGVMVDGVEPGGWAALARLATGDVITAVDGQPIASLDALTQKLKAVAAAKPASVVFRVRRGVRTLFVEIEPSWSK